MVVAPEVFGIPLKHLGKRAVKYAKMALIFTILGSAGILMGEKGLAEKYQLEHKRHVLQRENERLLEEIKNLERKVTLLRTDPSAIEKVAKRDLGMAGPDEIVYVFDTTRSPNRDEQKSRSGLRK